MTETQIQAVIFDRDGVLTYFDTVGAGAFFGALLPLTVHEIGGRWQMWGKHVGFPTSAAEEESFFASFWTALGQEYGLDPTHIARLIDRPYTDFVLAYPDAAPLLAALRAHGLRIGVLSNFSLFSLDASLAATGLAAYVDVAHAATIRGNAKPQAAAYLSIAQALAVPPAACLFIDDEMPCVAGATATGMRAIWLDRTRAQTQGAPDSSTDSPSDFQTAWTDGVLADLTEIEALLEAIGRGGEKAQ